MKVLKFGSRTLEGAPRVERIAGIVREAARPGGLCLVFSAFKGIQEQLVLASRSAEKGEAAFPDILAGIRSRYLEAIEALFKPRDRAAAITPIQILMNDLEDLLHGVQLVRECSQRSLDLISSFGSRFSAILLAAYLNMLGLEASLVEPQGLILTDGRYGNARVDFEPSRRRIAERLSRAGGVSVIPGGIASTAGGAVTSLGPNGSDHTASIVAAALEAEELQIWTNVDGVFSAEPASVPEAFVIPCLSYQEAMELSYFGARILHPQTMIPAVDRGIPIRIRNVDSPDKAGTLISAEARAQAQAVTGIASIDEVALVNIEGGGMVGIPGVAARIFRALGDAAVNVIMISQASSEHSICLVLRSSEAARGLEALRKELAAELEARTLQRLDLLEEVAILAVIGEKMRGTPGISGRLFSALGVEGVNVLAIAQGSSERNISLVIDRKDETRALRTVHRAFLGGG